MRKTFVVLGHADQDGLIDEDCQLRIKTVNELDEHTKENSYLLLAGGMKASHPMSEAKQMLSLVNWPQKNIILEEYSHTTCENAWFAVSMLPVDTQEMMLVCSHAHMFRARFFFKKALKRFSKNVKLSFLISPLPSFRAYLYELRWVHHLQKNIDSAEAKYLAESQ